MSGEIEQGFDLHTGASQAFGAMQVRKINHKQCVLNYATSPAQKLCGGKGRTTCCNEIINDDHALLVVNSTGIDFHTVAPVFQGIVDPDSWHGQFSRLADRHKAYAKTCGDGRPKNETARLNPCDELGTMAGRPVRKVINARRESGTVGNQRGHIAEPDALHRKVRHCAYKVLQIIELHI